MNVSFRPNSHDERDKVLAAVQVYETNPMSNATARTILEQIFGEQRREYVDFRDAYRHLSGVAAQCSDRTDAGDGNFDRKGRRWVRSLRHEDDSSRAGELTPLLNGLTVGEMFLKPCRQELTLSDGLFKQLASRPDLQGDPALLAEFQAASAELEPLVTADEAATRAKHQAGARLVAATDEFDRAYGKLVRAFRSLLGEEGTAAVLPRFYRKEPSGSSSPPTA